MRLRNAGRLAARRSTREARSRPPRKGTKDSRGCTSARLMRMPRVHGLLWVNGNVLQQHVRRLARRIVPEGLDMPVRHQGVLLSVLHVAESLVTTITGRICVDLVGKKARLRE